MNEIAQMESPKQMVEAVLAELEAAKPTFMEKILFPTMAEALAHQPGNSAGNQLLKYRVDQINQMPEGDDKKATKIVFSKFAMRALAGDKAAIDYLTDDATIKSAYPHIEEREPMPAHVKKEEQRIGRNKRAFFASLLGTVGTLGVLGSLAPAPKASDAAIVRVDDSGKPIVKEHAGRNKATRVVLFLTSCLLMAAGAERALAAQAYQLAGDLAETLDASLERKLGVIESKDPSVGLGRG